MKNPILSIQIQRTALGDEQLLITYADKKAGAARDTLRKVNYLNGKAFILWEGRKIDVSGFALRKRDLIKTSVAKASLSPSRYGSLPER